MVGGSGLHTARTGRRIRVPISRSRRFTVVLTTLFATSACVYFNALYNANRLFDRGRKEIEEEGRESTGRVTLENSIEKAQRIVENNPDSRWADDAWRLIARARLLREEWDQAVEASRSLMTYARTRADSAEVAGYLGRAELHLGDPLRADTLLSFALRHEEDLAERARLLHSRALARAEAARVEAADADLQEVKRLRPDWIQPRVDHVRVLVDYGRSRAAVEELISLMVLSFNDVEERQVVETIEHVVEADPEAARQALASAESSSLLRSNRAYLLKLRGDLNADRGDHEKARADYREAAQMAPDLRAGVDAQLALIWLELRGVSTLDQLDRPRSILERLARRPAGARSQEVNRLRDLFIRLDYWLDAGNLGYLLAAETVRDELGARRLARELFLRYANEQPQSLWAPKAILAALALDDLDSGGAGDDLEPSPAELRQRLLEEYRDSPYVKAVLGEEAEGRFTYEELELGLRRQLDRLAGLAEQEVQARRAGSTRP